MSKEQIAMHGSLYLMLFIFAIAGAVELYYRWRNPHPIITVAIEPCPIYGANAELDGVGQDTFVRCLNHNCAMQGPYGKDEIAAVKAWNALPRMSAIIAWQFQAAGAALALQRIMDAAQAMRDAQQAYEQFGSNEDSVADAEAVFDGLLADLRRVL